MAKAKTRGRPAGRRPVQYPQEKARPRRRINRIIWPAAVVIVALGAFFIAKEQAQGPSEAVVPPPTGLPQTPDYHSLLVAADDPNRVVLGSHAGLHETADGGRTWAVGNVQGQDAMNLVRARDGTVWMAGHSVLARSTDGGTTWSDVRPDGLPGLDVHGFAADPTEASRLYAALAGVGLFRSSDGGETFEIVSREVGPGTFGLAVTPQGRILATESQGIVLSDDGGETWRLALDAPVLGLAVNPADPSTILATGAPVAGPAVDALSGETITPPRAGILLSRDEGESWERVLPIEEGAGPVAWSASDPDVAYVVGFDRTLYRTSDRGASWQAVG